MAKQVLQIPVEEKQKEWIIKSMKEMRIKKQPEFIRMLLDFLMENNIAELKGRIEKARILARYKEAELAATEAMNRKEQLEKQLESIGA